MKPAKKRCATFPKYFRMEQRGRVAVLDHTVKSCTATSPSVTPWSRKVCLKQETCLDQGRLTVLKPAKKLQKLAGKVRAHPRQHLRVKVLLASGRAKECLEQVVCSRQTYLSSTVAVGEIHYIPLICDSNIGTLLRCQKF